MRPHPVILSIAGSDCSGGAGIQADIKTISALSGYAASVITSVTVQNTLGVQTICSLPSEIVGGQLEAVMEDLQPDAIKIGMINDAQIVSMIASCIRKYSPAHVVYDPVMLSTSGKELMTNETLEEIKENLLPLVTLVTPNIDEAMVLTNIRIENIEDMHEAGEILVDKYHTNFLIKGGHLAGYNVYDMLLLTDHTYHIYQHAKIKSKNLHGTGCTLSSAIATNLANGFAMNEAVQHAEEYIIKAIIDGQNLEIGKGNGPLWHFPDTSAQMCTYCAVMS